MERAHTHSNSFGMFETAVSAFVDEFPELLQKRKLAFTGFLCFILFILGLPCVTQGGMYVLQLMDWYSASFSLMIISLLEIVAICWVYGADRFMQDIQLMIKRVPPYWWKLCWCYITPATIVCLLSFLIINHKPVSYNGYTYPNWSVLLGWFMCFCSIAPIPIVAVVQLCKAEGTFKERLLTCLRPSPDWGPALEENRILYKKSLAIVSSRFRQLEIAGMDSNQMTTVVLNADNIEQAVSRSDSMPLNSESFV